MQEVLPSLEKCWPDMAVAHSYEYKLINIDEQPLRSIMSFLIQSDAIVIIAFNETIAKFMKEVRVKMQLPVPFVFHLHGLATISLWPFEHFQIMDALNMGDTFIGTCDGDRKCLDLIFEKSTFQRIPYPYYPLELNQQAQPQLVFAYIGRLSDQKNIDALIKAYKQLSDDVENCPPLFIYGAEDFLGSPNMGLPATDVLVQLKNLIGSYKLNENIILKGFKTREEIFSELGSNHIAVSASTHSDENFGMAIMRSLSLGANAVLTHWGGHIHFKQQFPERVLTVPVSLAEEKPQPDIDALKNAMKESLAKKIKSTALSSVLVPDYFNPQTVSNQFREILEQATFSEQKLQVKPEIKKLFVQKNNFTQSGEIQKIFESYNDCMARKFLNAYI